MKKLLALVLCVMLFVSVIPMGAFAATAPSSGKVDLSPAYEEMYKVLPPYYAALGGAQVYKNLVDGAAALSKILGLSSTVYKANQEDFDAVIKAAKTAGLNPNALFAVLKPYISPIMNMLGNAVVDSATTKIQKEETRVENAISSIATGMGLSFSWA